MYKIIITIALSFILLFASDSTKKPCNRCHSHNDYLGETPLFDAINYGYKSIEVDIVLDNGLLYVSHYRWAKKKNTFIENIYLDKLYQIFKENNGFIYRNSTSLFLLVDVKTAANETFEILNNSLKNYKDMLSHISNDSLIQGAVTIIISGNKPTIEYLGKSNERYVFLDGRLTDLGKNISINMMPLISINWKKEFSWRGYKNISEKEMGHLTKLIIKVHQEEKMIRFWGAPDNVKSWELLYHSGIDLINTDKIVELYNFVIEK